MFGFQILRKIDFNYFRNIVNLGLDWLDYYVSADEFFMLAIIYYLLPCESKSKRCPTLRKIFFESSSHTVFINSVSV